MVSLDKTFFLSSFRRYLSDTAITVFMAIFLIITIADVQDFFKTFEKEHLAFLILLFILLSYPFGLLINAFSYFAIFPITRPLCRKVFKCERLLRFIGNSNDFEQSKKYFKIKPFEDFYRVTDIIDKDNFVFKKFGIDRTYLPGLNLFARNIGFFLISVQVINIFYFLRSETSLLTPQIFWLTLLAIPVLILFCVFMEMYYGILLLYMLRILYTTIFYNDDFEREPGDFKLFDAPDTDPTPGVSLETNVSLNITYFMLNRLLATHSIVDLTKPLRNSSFE